MAQEKAEARRRRLIRAEKLAQEMSVLVDRLDEVSDQLMKELHRGLRN